MIVIFTTCRIRIENAEIGPRGSVQNERTLTGASDEIGRIVGVAVGLARPHIPEISDVGAPDLRDMRPHAQRDLHGRAIPIGWPAGLSMALWVVLRDRARIEALAEV